MTALPPTGTTFRPRANPDRDVIAYITRRLTTVGDTYRARVLVHAPASTLAATTPFPMAIESTDDSSCIIEIGSGDPARLALWLVQLNTDLEIIEGDQLRLAFNKLATRLHRATGTPVPPPSTGPDDR